MGAALAVGGCAPAGDGQVNQGRVQRVSQDAPVVQAVSVPADARGPVAAGLVQAVPPPPPPVAAEPAPGPQRAARAGADRQAGSAQPVRRSGDGQTARPAAPAPAPAPASVGGRAGAVAAAVNAQRSSHGLAPLASSSCAVRYAQQWANHLASTGAWGHQSLGPVMSGCSARGAGENIAKGSGAAAETVSAWMASPGHRANILDGGWTHAGMASAQAPDGRWLTVQVFLTL